MKRIAALQPLSREHHQSLLLAQKAIKTAASNDSQAIAQLCQAIVHDYEDTWQVHFKIEEDSIFTLIAQKQLGDNASQEDNERLMMCKNLCEQLQQEHAKMNAYYQQMKTGDKSIGVILAAFGHLLKQHTRTEERQLFVLLDEVLSTEELDMVLQISIDYR